jgi:hypothetical protein
MLLMTRVGFSWIETTENEVTWHSKETLKLYQSSPTAERGFCSTCGATALWKGKDEGDRIELSYALCDQKALEDVQKLLVFSFENDKSQRGRQEST